MPDVQSPRDRSLATIQAAIRGQIGLAEAADTIEALYSDAARRAGAVDVPVADSLGVGGLDAVEAAALAAEEHEVQSTEGDIEPIEEPEPDALAEEQQARVVRAARTKTTRG